METGPVIRLLTGNSRGANQLNFEVAKLPEPENMTTEERIQKIREETERINQRAAEMRTETEKMRKEFEEWQKRSDKRAAKRRKKSDKKWKELRKDIAKLTVKTEEHGKQIGGHNNKFGSHTEALAEPSIRRILDEYFDADYMESYESRSLQLDGWGVARNGSGAAYVVEVKSKFEPEHLDQVWRLVRMFRIEKPKFESREVYPILAVVEIEKEQRELVWESGIHLIDVSEGVFEWTRPPMGFSPCGDHGANGVVRRAVPRHLQLVTDKGGGHQQAH